MICSEEIHTTMAAPSENTTMTASIDIGLGPISIDISSKQQAADSSHIHFSLLSESMSPANAAQMFYQSNPSFYYDFIPSPASTEISFEEIPLMSPNQEYFGGMIPMSIPNSAISGKATQEEGSFPCDTCGKTFVKYFSLKSHLKSHLLTKDFKCEFCPASFRRSHDLKRHVRSLHTKAKSFHCPCGKKFSRADALKRHTLRSGSMCH